MNELRVTPLAVSEPDRRRTVFIEDALALARFAFGSIRPMALREQ
ncbi:MAG TPA: hypothetical protein VM120_09835 [Bryobacteraceae bacterium]|nr:hypothetical protein [Bryobacteraceae bacterium]